MNVLEKILEEIEERVNSRERLVKYEKRRGTVTDVCRNKGALEELDIIAKIIRSHMDHSGDDTEMGDWIPVEERSPNQNGVYNVTRLIDDAFISDSAYFDGQDTWHNDNRVNHARPYLTDIVAWQPLPTRYDPPVISKQAQDLRDRESFFTE